MERRKELYNNLEGLANEDLSDIRADKRDLCLVLSSGVVSIVGLGVTLYGLSVKNKLLSDVGFTIFGAGLLGTHILPLAAYYIYDRKKIHLNKNDMRIVSSYHKNKYKTI